MAIQRRYIGQLQRPGRLPENATLIADSSDPLNYKIRHLNVSSASGVLTLNIAEAQSFSCTLTENISSIAVQGPMVADEYWEFHVRWVQGSSIYSINYGSQFSFPGGTAHALTTTTGAVDACHFWSVDGGTTWYVTFVQGFDSGLGVPVGSLAITGYLPTLVEA